MKKILFVLSTLNMGGAQRIVSNIIMELPEEYEVDILLNDSQDIAYSYRGRIIDLGLPPQVDKKKLGYQIKVFFRRWKALLQLKKENQYIACISALDSANFANVLTKKKGCKTIVTIHGYHKRGWTSKKVEPIANWLIKATYNRADYVVTVSKGLEKEMQEKFGIKEEKLLTIFNGYNVPEILENAKKSVEVALPWKNDKQLIITSGRMVKVKGQWHLIKAFSIVAEKYPDARLVILGTGELREQLIQLIQQLKIEDKVFSPGFIKNPYAYLSKSKLFVLSSLSEGYPNAIAEALICGVPCVSCDCEAGPREILAETCNKQEMAQGFLKEKYGILTPAFDENDLWTNKEISSQEQIMADAICEMLENSDLYMHYKMKIIDKAKALDMKNVIYEWIDLLQ